MVSTVASPRSPLSSHSAPSPADSHAPQQGLDGVVIEADVRMIVSLFPSFFLSPSFFQPAHFLCLSVCLYVYQPC